VANRLTRAEQGKRNRGLVLAAARRVFLSRGYAGATLDAIADEAGFSKGVVYSQFAGKPDLFLALLEGRIAERAEQNARITAGLAGLDGLRALLQANARLSEVGGGWSRLLIEFRVIAARDPVLNARSAALHAQTLEHFTESIADLLARAGLTSAYPRREFAQLILAIDAGRVLEVAAGMSELQLEHLVDLLGRALVPSGATQSPLQTDQDSGGHDAHDNRTDALVPRTP
jgi:AcrR family transcriptional regulator